MKALIFLLLASCTTYATVARTNAPGLADLSTPLPRETGDPARFEAPSDPGFDTIAVFAIPYFGGGTGRATTQKGAFELGGELRFERARDTLLQRRAFGLGIGAMAQFGEQQRTESPVFAEATYRFDTGFMPAAVAVGAVLYPRDAEVGAQVSLTMFAIWTTYLRALPHSGFEVTTGYSIPVPFFFERSR